MNNKLFRMLFLLLFCTYGATAQIKRGTRMVNASVGSVAYNSGTGDVSYPGGTQGYTSINTSFGLDITPSMGWFISDNTAVGASLKINPGSQKVSYESGGSTFQKDKATTFNIGLGGFARNYFNTSNVFMPFGQLGVNLGISSRKTEGFFYGGSGPGVYKDTYEGKSSGGFFANAALSLGLTKMLNNNTGLDFFAGYNFSYSKNTLKTTSLRDNGNNGTVDQTSISEPITRFTNHGFLLGVGFQVFLDGKK